MSLLRQRGPVAPNIIGHQLAEQDVAGSRAFGVDKVHEEREGYAVAEEGHDLRARVGPGELPEESHMVVIRQVEGSTHCSERVMSARRLRSVPMTSEDRQMIEAAVERQVDSDRDLLVALRRRLHAHPELSGDETATTELIMDQLTGLGLAPIRLAVGTGVVCDVPVGAARSGSDGSTPGPVGPVVALRADIDALAMQDDKQVAYRSQVPGVAHACGHDVHTTVLIGVARALAGLGDRADVSGTVRLIFEPSEESVPGGAVDVINEGWLAGVSSVYGLHCDPKLDVGLLGCRTGAVSSAADLVEVRLRGPGGHTARPALTLDLVGVLAELVVGIQPALDRRTGKGGVLQAVFGAIHAGEASNVIPALGLLRGTLRTPDHAIWLEAPALFESAVADVLEGVAATFEVRHRRGVPPVVNTGPETDLLARVAARTLGPEAAVPTVQSMGGDSFAWYLERVPGSYGRLGVHPVGSDLDRLDLHASTFDVDERAIGYGVSVLTAAALESLRAAPASSAPPTPPS